MQSLECLSAWESLSSQWFVSFIRIISLFSLALSLFLILNQLIHYSDSNVYMAHKVQPKTVNTKPAVNS